MITNAMLGFDGDADDAANPHVRRSPFGGKRSASAKASSPASSKHPADEHLTAALAHADPNEKRKRVFAALSALRRGKLGA
jgi:hypothetical protein